jgi:hypothetical protein
MGIFLSVPFLALICCCSSSISSLVLCGDKIPIISGELPEIYASLSSSTCIALILCIVCMVGTFWAGGSAASALLTV